MGINDMPIFIKIIFISLFIGLFYASFNVVMCFEPDEYDFCEEQGYNYVNWNGGLYLEYKNEDYGRIICTRYFVEGRESKEFNVTNTKWGFVLVANSEQGGKNGEE